MKNIMVCVTQQKNCKRLIRTGADLLKESEDKGELFVIHVSKMGSHFLGKEKDGDALEYLFEKAKEHGANLTVVRSDNIVKTLVDLTNKYHISHVVMGSSLEQNSLNDISKQFTESIDKKVVIEIVP